MKATKHILKYKPFSFKCAAYHRLKRPIAPFNSNVSETQPTQVRQGFPEHKRELPELIHPNCNVQDDLLISDDDFALKGSLLA